MSLSVSTPALSRIQLTVLATSNKKADFQIKNFTLAFFGKTDKYIASKPIRGSQKTKWIDDNCLDVTLQLIINYELEKFILSYADSIK
jgi:hypothetical protein